MIDLGWAVAMGKGPPLSSCRLTVRMVSISQLSAGPTGTRVLSLCKAATVLVQMRAGAESDTSTAACKCAIADVHGPLVFPSINSVSPSFHGGSSPCPWSYTVSRRCEALSPHSFIATLGLCAWDAKKKA
jgi:hypothetical protein